MERECGEREIGRERGRERKREIEERVNSKRERREGALRVKERRREMG